MNKPYFILDLDETLISGVSKKEKHTPKKLENYNMDNYYTIYCRPHLQEFLDYVFEHFNVIIWTAASKDYCLFIVEKIILKKPERTIFKIFFSYHCSLSKKFMKSKNVPKKLSIMWENFGLSEMNKNNVVILDDFEDVYNCQKDNCISAKSFDALKDESEKDTFLKDLLVQLTESDLKNTKQDEFCNAIQTINKSFGSN